MRFAKTRNVVLACSAVLFATTAVASSEPAGRKAAPAVQSEAGGLAVAAVEVSAQRRKRMRQHRSVKPRAAHRRAARVATARPVAADPVVDIHAVASGTAPAASPTGRAAYAAVPPVERPQRRSRRAVATQPQASFAGLGGGSVVAEARRHLGTNPTGRSSLWCATFMNMVLERTGHGGTGSNLARSFASYGTRVSGPQVGAIAVMSRGRRGGHVGVVSGIDASGNPIVISGNHGRRVAEAVYPRGRIFAYVMP
jgi:uncharacterized protein (TIGR02594 family)